MLPHMSNPKASLDLSHYGPWAVVAGGSEGVGAAFAHLLANAGINLVLVARRPNPLEATASECRARGVQVRTLSLDLTEQMSASRIVEATRGIEVGLLAYNAGADTSGTEFLEGDFDQTQRVVDLNITTPLTLVHHYAHAMRDRRRGGILLVGSLAGYLGSARHTVYGGAKAFGRIFAEGLWLELRGHGVHVLELVLGLTRTPAMGRLGLNFDIPGVVVSEPMEVATEGLRHLPDGPVRVVSGNDAEVARRSSHDRAKIVLRTHRLMSQLVEG